MEGVLPLPPSRRGLPCGLPFKRALLGLDAEDEDEDAVVRAILAETPRDSLRWPFNSPFNELMLSSLPTTETALA